MAIALIEEGMDPMESIAFIRKHRRGAINKQQIAYLEKYRKDPLTRPLPDRRPQPTEEAANNQPTARVINMISK